LKQFIRPNTTGPSGGVITDNFVFTAASAIDPKTMKRVPEADTVHNEVAVILDRISAVLAEAELTLKDLTKVTVWLSEEKYRFDFIPAYRDLLAPGPFPSRGLFTIGLPGDCRLQLDVIAARRKPAAATED
jgi:2-iminobutanoate/2-iminopropanoate deaminase